MKVRVICQSTEDGSSEYVTFTEEDFDDDAKDYLYPNHTINSDVVIDMDEIPGFPLEHDLKRT